MASHTCIHTKYKRVNFLNDHLSRKFSLIDRDVGREMSEPGSSNQNKMTSNKVFFKTKI
jgi:hypothetical protein